MLRSRFSCVAYQTRAVVSAARSLSSTRSVVSSRERSCKTSNRVFPTHLRASSALPVLSARFLSDQSRRSDNNADDSIRSQSKHTESGAPDRPPVPPRRRVGRIRHLMNQFSNLLVDYGVYGAFVYWLTNMGTIGLLTIFFMIDTPISGAAALEYVQANFSEHLASIGLQLDHIDHRLGALGIAWFFNHFFGPLQMLATLWLTPRLAPMLENVGMLRWAQIRFGAVIRKRYGPGRD